MPEPRVLNMRSISPQARANAVYIGRGGPWGNPFVIGVDGDRDEVCDKFDAWIKQPEQQTLRERAKVILAGRDLVCYCEPERCHGRTWLRIANAV